MRRPTILRSWRRMLAGAALGFGLTTAALFALTIGTFMVELDDVMLAAAIGLITGVIITAVRRSRQP